MRSDVGRIPDGWREEPVESFATRVAMGPFGSNIKVECFVPSGIPIISGGNLRSFRLDNESDFNFVSDEKAKQLLSANAFQKEIIFTHAGNIGQVAYIPTSSRFKRYVMSQRQFKLAVRHEEVDYRYITYFFKSPVGQHRLLANASQVGVPSISRPVSNLKQLRVILPPRSEQVAIAETLDALDEAIAINRKINATLEATAQAIFKSWFVDFDPVRAKSEGRPPECMDEVTAALFPSEFEESELGLVPNGWKTGSLGELCFNFREGAKPEALTHDTPYFGLEHMPRKSISLNDWGLAAGLVSGKFRFKRSDILFGKLRPYFHKVGIAPVDGVCSTDILVIRAKASEWYGLAMAHLSSSILIEYATQLSNGAKMPRTNWNDLANYRIVIPDADTAAVFSGIVGDIVEQIQANIITSKTLIEIRDSLLPKLVSGQIRIPETKEEFSEAL